MEEIIELLLLTLQCAIVEAWAKKGHFINSLVQICHIVKVNENTRKNTLLPRPTYTEDSHLNDNDTFTQTQSFYKGPIMQGQNPFNYLDNARNMLTRNVTM